MKNIKFLFVFAALFTSIISCSKEQETTINPVETNVEKILAIGDFVSAVHPTSGKAKVIKTTDGKTKIQLENFTTDAGPDLKIYLATDKSAKTFVEVFSKPKNGTYSFDIDSNIDLTTNKFLLIWCKSFSVLFGSAELK